MPFFDESNFYPDQSPGYLVRAVNQSSIAAIDRVLADDAMTATQWVALISIHFGMGDTCAALARSMAHDKGAMTRLIDQLEANGWVQRQRDAGDRRHVRLSLTDAGFAAASAARRKVIALWNGFLADWSDAEIAAMIQTLTRLRQSLERQSCAA